MVSVETGRGSWALGGVCFLFNGPSLRGILQVINSAERVSCWVGGAWCGPGPVGVALPPGSCFLGGGLEGVPMGALGCSTNAACLLFICFKYRGTTHFLIHENVFTSS